MKERPILFSGPMVRAILSGQKTVTRRTVKGAGLKWLEDFTPEYVAHPENWLCPYGQSGDRLWVRESLRYDCEYGHYFAAGGAHGETVYLCSLFDDEEAQTGPSYDGLLPERSVPSIHLHRRYSRILLEITEVRVERLQDISDEQVVAEGIEGCIPSCSGPYDEDGNPECDCMNLPYQQSFQILWESINGPESWDTNPWVWVVEFKRVTP